MAIEIERLERKRDEQESNLEELSEKPQRNSVKVQISLVRSEIARIDAEIDKRMREAQGLQTPLPAPSNEGTASLVEKAVPSTRLHGLNFEIDTTSIDPDTIADAIQNAGVICNVNIMGHRILHEQKSLYVWTVAHPNEAWGQPMSDALSKNLGVQVKYVSFVTAKRR